MSFQSQLDAGAGGTVVIDPGTYNEFVTVPENTVCIMPNVTLDGSGFDDAMLLSNGSSVLGLANPTDPIANRGRIINPDKSCINVATFPTDTVVIKDLYLANWNNEYLDGGQGLAAIALPYTHRYTIERCRLEGLDSRTPQTNGIWAKGNTATLTSEGPCRIAYNHISHCWDGIGSETEDDDNGGFPPNTVIEWNTITDCQDDGIQAEGRGENVYVLHNHIVRCSIGIAIAPVRIGPTYVRWNIIEANVQGNSDPSGFKIGDNPTNTGDIYIQYNVIDLREASHIGDCIQRTNVGLQPMIIDHNRVNVGRYIWNLESEDAPEGTVVDFNSVYTTQSNAVKWFGDQLTWAAYLSQETPQDANSVFTDELALIL